ncbi:MAG: protease modulator HflK, partial [Gammaproteobacteria bacterium HGW-Gammaproteobacteria-7]
PEVTRERLYLETMQEVMSNTSKVMVSGDGGQNLLYLPLDKMINSRGASTPAPAGVVSGAATQGTRLPPELDPREVRTMESR